MAGAFVGCDVVVTDAFGLEGIGVPGVFVGWDVAVAGAPGLEGIGAAGVFVGCDVVVADAADLEGIGVAGAFVDCDVSVTGAPGLEGITERPADDPIGRIIPGVRAGAVGSPWDLAGVPVLFSAFAELTGPGGFAGEDVDVSGCTIAGLVISDALSGEDESGGVARAAGAVGTTVGLGVSGALVSSEESGGAARAVGVVETVGLGVSVTLARSDGPGSVVEATGVGDTAAGCDGSSCDEAAGGFVTLPVGRVGKTGGRIAVLGRMGLLSNFFGENVCLVSGCIVRAGESDVVLSPAGVCAGFFVSFVLGVEVDMAGNGFPLF